MRGNTLFVIGSLRTLPDRAAPVSVFIDPGGAIYVGTDPRCPQSVYIGMGYVGERGRHRGGVLWSEDNGGTFASLSSGRTVHLENDDADAASRRPVRHAKRTRPMIR